MFTVTRHWIPSWGNWIRSTISILILSPCILVRLQNDLPFSCFSIAVLTALHATCHSHSLCSWTFCTFLLLPLCVAAGSRQLVVILWLCSSLRLSEFNFRSKHCKLCVSLGHSQRCGWRLRSGMWHCGFPDVSGFLRSLCEVTGVKNRLAWWWDVLHIVRIVVALSFSRMTPFW